MNNEENTNIPIASGCDIPNDAIFYKDCGCNKYGPQPQKVCTFNLNTNTLSVSLTGEF